MNLEDKIIGAHKGFFNKESEKRYRENSLELCKIASTKDYIRIIEVDVRKSKDGILYCYHGNLLEYYTVFKFPRNFGVLKKKYNVDTLGDILSVISEEKMIFLDLKDHTITRDDILKAVNGKKFKEVILGNRSTSFLSRFHDMPRGFVKCINGNVFSFLYDLRKLKGANYKYFELALPFLLSEKRIKKVQAAGLVFVGVPSVLYLSTKSYWRAVEKYGLTYISSDFI